MQAPKNISHWFGFSVVMLCAILLNMESALGMVTLWLTTDTYMHGAFVIPLSFILAKSRPFPSSEAKPLSLFLAVPILLLWMAGVIFGHLSMLNVIQQVMLISVIPMTVMLCYGWRITWHYIAPLCLLFFAVPVGDFLIPTLQSVTADMSVWFLQLSGVSVLMNGWYISIPAADFRVAEACSGINFLISTFTVAVFYAFFYMEKYYKRCAFILMGLIVPILANGLRVYLIIMIADSGNVEAATGFDHLVYGWIFFVVILIALFALGSWWQDPAPTENESGLILSSKPLTSNYSNRITIIQLTVLITIAFMFWHNVIRDHKSNVVKVGSFISDGDILAPKFPKSDFITYKNLDSGWRQYQIHYESEATNKKIIGYQNRWFDGKVWSIEDSSSLTLANNSSAHKWELIDLHGRKGTLVYSYCVGGKWTSSTLETKVSQVLSRLRGDDFGATAYAWFSVNNNMNNNTLPDSNALSEMCSK